MNAQEFFAERASFMKASEIRELLKWVTEGDVISFGGGMPDPATFPISEITSIVEEGLRDKGDKLLQYGSTEGVKELREELIHFMDWRGLKVQDIDNLLIVSGSQQGLDMLGRVLIDKGDIVLLELPTYLAAINAFRVYEPQFKGLKMDDNGIKMDLLEGILKRLESRREKPKLLYTVPTCQNPSGVTLSQERRKHLLELASEYDFLIVEDDPYSFFTYDPIQVKHLKSLDKEGRVIYMSTFSKILSPGLRLGWITADKDFINKFVLAKQSMDLCTSPLIQHIAYRAIKDGVVQKNLPKSKELYRRKRDKMLEAINNYFPEGCRWTKPIGGLFIFAWMPKEIDTKEMIQNCIQKYGVVYVPGQSFFVDGSGRNTMRLNFTYPSIDEIEQGIKKLGKVIKQRLKK
jgi:2-aminoadipate transaminase